MFLRCFPAQQTTYRVGNRVQLLFKEKSERVSRPSEHPPVRGENVKTFRWDHRLQIQNLLWHLNGFP